MLFLESQHKGQVGNYFQHLELLIFVFATLNLHNENYAHTHTEKVFHLFWFGYNFTQHNRDRLFASLFGAYNRITIW